MTPTHVILAALIGAISMQTGVVAADTQTESLSRLNVAPWMQCIDNIHSYFRLTGLEESQWLPNPCGFSSMSKDNVLRDIFFHRIEDGSPSNTSAIGTSENDTQSNSRLMAIQQEDREQSDKAKRKPLPRGTTIPEGVQSPNATRVIAFAGDSTMLRTYWEAYNMYVRPTEEQAYEAPAASTTTGKVFRAVHGSAKPGDNLTTDFHWRDFMYASMHEPALESIRAAKEGGIVVIGWGNHDLGWKIKKAPMPGMKGRATNYSAVTDYWVENVGSFMKDVARELQSIPIQKRPIVLIRELALPFCYSPRFQDPKKSYRKCYEMLRPEVVPMYRRVLSSLAWSLGIPVLPVDGLFRDNYVNCRMDDGIHLNPECRQHFLQIVWNAVRLMQRVRDGLPIDPTQADKSQKSTLDQGSWHSADQGIIQQTTSNASEGTAWNGRAFIDGTVFDAWRQGFTRSAPGSVDSTVHTQPNYGKKFMWRPGNESTSPEPTPTPPKTARPRMTDAIDIAPTTTTAVPTDTATVSVSETGTGAPVGDQPSSKAPISSPTAPPRALAQIQSKRYVLCLDESTLLTFFLFMVALGPIARWLWTVGERPRKLEGI